MASIEGNSSDTQQNKPVIEEKKHGFPFINLPRELRDKVYVYLLHQPTVDKRTSSYQPIDMWDNGSSGFCDIAICLANRQISQEALFILYSRNSFTFKYPLDLRICAPSIGVTNTNSIRSICISVEARIDPRWGFDVANRNGTDVNWASALMDCGIRRLKFLSVDKKDRNPGVGKRFHGQSKTFTDAIKAIFERDQEKGLRPHIEFCGYDDDIREHFSEDWLITLNRSPSQTYPLDYYPNQVQY